MRKMHPQRTTIETVFDVPIGSMEWKDDHFLAADTLIWPIFTYPHAIQIVYVESTPQFTKDLNKLGHDQLYGVDDYIVAANNQLEDRNIIVYAAEMISNYLRRHVMVHDHTLVRLSRSTLSREKLYLGYLVETRDIIIG